jgi:hypothetical protein
MMTRDGYLATALVCLALAAIAICGMGCGGAPGVDFSQATYTGPMTGDMLALARKVRQCEGIPDTVPLPLVAIFPGDDFQCQGLQEVDGKLVPFTGYCHGLAGGDGWPISLAADALVRSKGQL